MGTSVECYRCCQQTQIKHDQHVYMILCRNALGGEQNDQQLLDVEYLRNINCTKTRRREFVEGT